MKNNYLIEENADEARTLMEAEMIANEASWIAEAMGGGIDTDKRCTEELEAAYPRMSFYGDAKGGAK